MHKNKQKIIDLTMAKRSSDGFVGHCPAHDDRNPSFSFKFVADRKNPLVTCHAGCSFKEIVQALKSHDCWEYEGNRYE